MVHQCVETRNGYYVIEASESTDVAEGMILYKSTNCIECNDSRSLTNCMWMNECKQCYDCSFCRNCDGCQNCIGCY